MRMCLIGRPKPFAQVSQVKYKKSLFSISGSQAAVRTMLISGNTPDEKAQGHQTEAMLVKEHECVQMERKKEVGELNASWP